MSIRRNKTLSPKIDHYGYLCVLLCVANVRKHITVHRLVALTFLENPGNKPAVNHKDGNKQNNNILNLEWVTVQENAAHAYRTGLARAWNKDKKNCYSKKQIEQMRLSQRCKEVVATKNGESKIFKSLHEMNRIMGFDRRTAQRILQKQKHFHSIKGYTLAYRN